MGALVADFRRVNDDDAAQLRSAVQRADCTHATTFAHRIKGACLMLGAEPLAGTCLRIERAASASDLAAIRAAMPDFDAELARLDDYLDASFPASRQLSLAH